jgi:hypothetical protein
VSGKRWIVETVEAVEIVKIVKAIISRLPFDELPGTTPGTGRTGKAASTDKNLSILFF